jgi:hypothetical protein
MSGGKVSRWRASIIGVGLDCHGDDMHSNPQDVQGVSNPNEAVRQHRPETAQAQYEHHDGAGLKRLEARGSRSPIRDTRGRGGSQNIRQGSRASMDHGGERGFGPRAVRPEGNEFPIERGLDRQGRMDARREHQTAMRDLGDDESMGPTIGVGVCGPRSMPDDAQVIESDSVGRERRSSEVGRRGIVPGVDGQNLPSLQVPEPLHTHQSVPELSAQSPRKEFDSAKRRAEADRDSRRAPYKTAMNAADNRKVDLLLGNSAGVPAGSVRQQCTELKQRRTQDESTIFEPKTVVSDRINPIQSNTQRAHGDTSVELVGVGMVLEPENPGEEGLCYVSDVKVGGPLDKCGKVQVMDRLWAVDDFRCTGSTRSEIRNHVMGR